MIDTLCGRNHSGQQIGAYVWRRNGKTATYRVLLKFFHVVELLVRVSLVEHWSKNVCVGYTNFEKFYRD